MSTRTVTVALLLLGLATPVFAVQAFMDLGTNPYDPSISKDGTLIGGRDATGGFVAINGVKTYTAGATPVDVEYRNGVATAVGKTSSAAVWQAGTGWQTLPLVSSTTWTPTGIGVNASNTMYVSGYTGDSSGRTPIRYDSITDASTNIGVPSNGSDGRALAVADTGAIGGAADNGGSPRNAFYGQPVSWLYCNTSPGIGDSVESEVFDISSDGITKVGWGYAASGAWQGYYWTSGTAHLVPLYNGVDWAEMHAVNGDGSFMGGWSETPGYSGAIAIVYNTSWTSPKSVTQYLADLGVNTAGWSFTNVTGISADGTSLVGTGTYGGVAHSWAFSVVPEPGTLSLLVVGLGLLIRRK